MKITEKIEQIVEKLKTRKSKNMIYWIVVALMFFAFAYRFYVVEAERNASVFNIIRNNANNGTPVNVLKMTVAEVLHHE